MSKNTLPVVDRTYALLKWYLGRLEKFPRSHRYGLGQRIEGTLYGLFEGLVRACYASAGAKAPELTEVNLKLEILRMHTRLPALSEQSLDDVRPDLLGKWNRGRLRSALHSLDPRSNLRRLRPTLRASGQVLLEFGSIAVDPAPKLLLRDLAGHDRSLCNSGGQKGANSAQPLSAVPAAREATVRFWKAAHTLSRSEPARREAALNAGDRRPLAHVDVGQFNIAHR